MGARATDLATVFFIEFVLVVLQIFWFMNDVSDRIQPEPWQRSFMATVIFIGIYAIYEVLFHTRANGQTPGKILFRVKLISRKDGATTKATLNATPGAIPDAAPNENPNATPGAIPDTAPRETATPKWWQTAIRWPLVGIAFPLLFAPNLGFPNFLILIAIALAPGITAVFSKNRLGIHDLIAGTAVILHEPTEEETREIERMRELRQERREKYSLWRIWTDRGSGVG